MANLHVIVIALLVGVQCLLVLSASATEAKEVSKEEVDRRDKVSREELDEIRRKVDSMDDEQLSTVLYAVMPRNRYKRTVGTVRRCIEKVRCLFSGQKRQKRDTSPAVVLRAIGKLTGLASNAANELSNRFGFGGSDFSLSSLFGDAPSGSDDATADDDSATGTETEDLNVAEGSEVVEEKVCDQKCQLSIGVYRRLRELLKTFVH